MQSAQEFFEKTVRPYLPALAPLGVLKVCIEGENGGEWYLDGTKGEVSRNKQLAHVIVRAEWRDFLALIEGKMSAHDGLLTGRLHLAGEAERLTTLGRLFAGQAGYELS